MLSAYSKITRKVLILADNEVYIPPRPELASQPPKPAPQPHNHTGNHFVFAFSVFAKSFQRKCQQLFPRVLTCKYIICTLLPVARWLPSL